MRSHTDTFARQTLLKIDGRVRCVKKLKLVCEKTRCLHIRRQKHVGTAIRIRAVAEFNFVSCMKLQMNDKEQAENSNEKKNRKTEKRNTILR